MRRFTLPLCIAVAALASGLAASSAFASAYGNLSFFAGGGGSAGWTGAPNKHSAVQLSAPSAGDFAGIALNRFSPAAPADAPSFTTSNYAAGSPRLVIEFAGGADLFGYPSQFNSQWEVANCAGVAPNDYTDYATALADRQAGKQTDNSSCAGNVTGVFVVADGSGGNPETDTITSLVYGGTSYIG